MGVADQYAPQGGRTLGEYAQSPDLTKLVMKAQRQYPFIAQYNPMVSLGQGDGYAETWPAGEQGDQQRPRPSEFPIHRHGVQIFRPNEFGPSDLAAEFLHVDPFANQTRSALMSSMTPQQLARLKQASGDYAMTIRNGEGEQRAVQNAIDSALRGYTTGQWPAQANASMGYSPEQTRMLDGLKSYMMTGRK